METYRKMLKAALVAVALFVLTLALAPRAVACNPVAALPVQTYSYAYTSGLGAPIDPYAGYYSQQLLTQYRAAPVYAAPVYAAPIYAAPVYYQNYGTVAVPFRSPVSIQFGGRRFQRVTIFP